MHSGAAEASVPSAALQGGEVADGLREVGEVVGRGVQMGEVRCTKLIKSPSGIIRARNYHGCVLTDIDEGEQINIGTMTLPKTITMQYIKTTIV